MNPTRTPTREPRYIGTHHLIVPDPRAKPHAASDDWYFEMIVQAVRTQLTPRLGGGEKLHFIDTWQLHTGLGDIHCATNVIRDLKLKVRP
jgi:hypothetical protein